MSPDTRTWLRSLLDYDRWANDKMFEAASQVNDGELDRKSGASFESIRGSIAHVLQAQRTWLGRWTGGSPELVADVSLGGLRTAYAATHTALCDFLDSRTEEQLAAVIAYTDSAGEPHARRAWQLIAHVVNHGTHHRAETGMLLGMIGHSPGDMDYLYFAPDERSTP